MYKLENNYTSLMYTSTLMPQTIPFSTIKLVLNVYEDSIPQEFDLAISVKAPM